jgi:DNA repair ATPase RecN
MYTVNSAVPLPSPLKTYDEFTGANVHPGAITAIIIAKTTEMFIKNLSDKEKVREVARMLAGAEITDISLQHAEELIGRASAF